jgi:hypothetical protein
VASKRCSLCGIGYPPDWKFNKCPIHETETWLDNKSDPDPDWAARAERLVRQMERDAAIAALIPTIEAKVVHADGQLWVSSHDVIRAGIRHRLPADAIIRIGQQHFEIQGYSDSRRAYLVEVFSMELSAEDLRRLADG